MILETLHVWYSLVTRPTPFSVLCIFTILPHPCIPKNRKQGNKAIVWYSRHYPLNVLFNLASQMWLLARLLPIIIGAKVSDDNEWWANTPTGYCRLAPCT